MMQALVGLPQNADVLLVRPAPAPILMRWRCQVLEVPPAELSKYAASVDCVVDAGELARSGLVMDLGTCQWDALGCVEDVLGAVAVLLGPLRPGGRLLVHIAGDQADYLAGYLSAFPIEIRELPGSQVYECLVKVPVGPEHLQAALVREVFEERSHRRYADMLDTALGDRGLEILDVGGGDGHMAAWWAASGHNISLLEVDSAQVKAAEVHLGRDKVTLHDGVSRWPYADRSFDVCLFFHVLHHIRSEDAVRSALREAARVSRRQVFILEDQPRAATSPGMRRLAVAVTAEHFRPFNQDPNVFMRNIRSDISWQALFASAGLRVAKSELLPGTLQHPVPHVLYCTEPQH